MSELVSRIAETSHSVRERRRRNPGLAVVLDATVTGVHHVDGRGCSTPGRARAGTRPATAATPAG